jgi:hypothetical protein
VAAALQAADQQAVIADFLADMVAIAEPALEEVVAKLVWYGGTSRYPQKGASPDKAGVDGCQAVSEQFAIGGADTLIDGLQDRFFAIALFFKLGPNVLSHGCT